MPTPFDAVIAGIIARGFHNHRLEDHSDAISEGLFRDLLEECDAFREDLEAGTIKHWLNVNAPGARERKIDLFVGEPSATGKHDLSKIRLALENKSVITAHRNKDSRFDDLNEALQVIHRVKPDTIIIATVLVGLATRVLNIPDAVKKTYKSKMAVFNRSILPRLSRGDQSLWSKFDWAISKNRSDDPQKTVAKFRSLPLREPAQTHKVGYDYVLLVPVIINNVDPPTLAPSNTLGIDLDRDYADMLSIICTAYTARWHPRSLTRRR
jgi:hypothetical protein